MRKFLTVLILLFFSVPAYSEIGKITVEMAWKNIAEADGFEVKRFCVKSELDCIRGESMTQGMKFSMCRP